MIEIDYRGASEGTRLLNTLTLIRWYIAHQDFPAKEDLH